MHNAKVSITALFLVLALPAWPAKLVDAPPPPPMPEGLAEEDVRPAVAPAGTRMGLGKTLYRAHCLSCHESVAGMGARRGIRSLEDLRAEVSRRAADAKLQWSAVDLEAVASHLNDTHYHFTP